MKCSIRGCPGEYEERLISHSYVKDGRIIVVADIPAEVCDVCGDTLLKPGIADAVHQTLEHAEKASEFAPVLRLGQKVA